MTRALVRVFAAAAVASALMLSVSYAGAAPIDVLNPVTDWGSEGDWLSTALDWFHGLFGLETGTTPDQRPTSVYAKAGGPTGPCIDPLGEQLGTIRGCE